MNAFDVVADLSREVVARGVNQYVNPLTASRLASHLAAHQGTGHVLFVGESPASSSQAVPFTDDSRTSRVFNRVLGDYRVARWNAWPFWLPRGSKPNAAEKRRGAEYARQVAVLVQARRVFAVGRVAEQTLNLAGVACVFVPHPAQDHARDFAKQITDFIEEDQAS